jgi:hypothetical protein
VIASRNFFVNAITPLPRFRCGVVDRVQLFAACRFECRRGSAMARQRSPSARIEEHLQLAL